MHLGNRGHNFVRLLIRTLTFLALIAALCGIEPESIISAVGKLIRKNSVKMIVFVSLVRQDNTELSKSKIKVPCLANRRGVNSNIMLS